MPDKVFETPNAAVADIKNGASIAISGFGLGHGVPASLIVATHDAGVGDLTLICNSLGRPGTTQAQVLVENNQVASLICSFSSRPGLQSAADEKLESGEIELQLVPQGIMVERLRAAGSGLAAFYSPTGVGTELYADHETRQFGDKTFVLEQALPVDFAFLRAWRADRSGNVQFQGSNIHFGICMAKAATTAIVEVEEIVDIGVIPPEAVDLPGIFVGRVVKSTVVDEETPGSFRLKRPADVGRTYNDKSGWTRLQMAERVAQLLPENGYVNLGSGMPSLVARCIEGLSITLHGENGILNYQTGEAAASPNKNVFDASGSPVEIRPGGAFFDSTMSFDIARASHLNAVVLGGYQVDDQGNLANYSLGNPKTGGIGGAMDLVAGKQCVIAMLEHRDSKDRPKLLKRCTLPLTGRECVDYIVTDLAILRRSANGFEAIEIADGFTLNEIQALAEMTIGSALS